MPIETSVSAPDYLDSRPVGKVDQAGLLGVSAGEISRQRSSMGRQLASNSGQLL
jgi:hypothetical protein